MAYLQVSLFGTFHVTVAGEAISRFRSQRERALLAYLAVEADHAHGRDRLATLLWPDKPAATARQNLRQTLTNLRAHLQTDQMGAPFLLAEQQTLQWNQRSDQASDVATFTAALAATTTHAHGDLADCASCLKELNTAVALYQGPLLVNFALNDSDLFEEWLLLRRIQFHQQALSAFHQLTTVALQQREWPQALAYAQRQVELEPLQEEAHYQWLQALVGRGDRSKALAHFEQFRTQLWQELAVEPAAATLALVAQIRNDAMPAKAIMQLGSGGCTTYERFGSLGEQQGENGPQVRNDAVTGAVTITSSPDPSATQPRRHDWGGAVGDSTLIGRAVEERELQRWLHGGVQVITILGLAGVGKSALAQAVAHSQGKAFPVLIWRSLVNATPLTALLHHWLSILVEAPAISLPENLDRQLDLLFEQLRQQRALLILDNVESIMMQDRAGRFRPGYEGYGLLLQRMAQEEHASVLLLTSREQPQALAHLDGERSVIRSLPLAGLTPTAGQALLLHYGLALTDADANQLVQRFSGNSLILKFIAHTVQELFDGDINAFLTEETPVYGDIRDLFDQYRTRIPYVEKVIIMWLAIHREPMPIAQVQAALRPPVSTNTFLDAIRSLQRRALIEQTPAGFTVPDVVMMIMIEYLLEVSGQEIIDQTHGLLNHYRLIDAQASEELRQSQYRVIVMPLIERLVRRFGRAGLIKRLQGMLTAMSYNPPPNPGYLADNLAILLHYLYSSQVENRSLESN